MAQTRKTTTAASFNPEELLAFLRQDELDYPAGAAKFGKAALPLLSELIEGEDENLAIKAAYLVGYIEDASSGDILQLAAERGSAPIRIAAAYGAQKLKTDVAESILSKSLDDNDPSVVKFAMRSVSQLNMGKTLKSKLNRISKEFLNEEVKLEASEILKKVK